ncbi:MAG: PsbP-related protein [Flavobacteriaceae bacterium]|nr:PsbP-related protein [Flavobacteriaceae bacterium]
MRRKISIFLITLFCLSFSSAQVDHQWNQIEKESYSINYPSNWQLDTSGRNKTEFIILSKREENDPFRENVNLIIQDLSNHIMNLESFVKLSEDVIKQTPSATIIESKKIENDGRTYHQIIWKGFISKQILKFKQLFFIKNNRAYTLTLTGREKEFENYLPIGDKILTSFILK